ncbi:MAG: GTP cyclohydrolase FolE2 [Desulfovibrionaceae bacterium]
MEDVQSGPPRIALCIDKVGVKDLHLPLLVRDRAQGRQHTVATVDMGVELPSSFKGTHMSRFVEALENWGEELDYHSVKTLLEDVKTRLGANRAYVVFRFPYFMRKEAPASGSSGLVWYQCRLTGDMTDSKPEFLLEVDVPVTTVCPCSKAISVEGAHGQRTVVHLAVRMKGFSWLEEFIEIAESGGSAQVYTLLKREDEKFVTEQAFANPTFVEDVVRAVAVRLAEHPQISWFRVEVESFESIHCHNAFACIERTLA